MLTPRELLALGANVIRRRPTRHCVLSVGEHNTYYEGDLPKNRTKQNPNLNLIKPLDLNTGNTENRALC